MASWVTHLMIADGVLERLSGLEKRGFCVGNIAPDCNVENEDWTVFTPPREATHWMRGERKSQADAEAFREEYLTRRLPGARSGEERAFLLGYYAHLLTDAAFQAMLRDEERVRAAWGRIRTDGALHAACCGLEETWDGVKRLIPKAEWMRGIYSMESEYLEAHPQSGYWTEILLLRDFPDYIDYLPRGAIVRKIERIGYLPKAEPGVRYLAISREEHAQFVRGTIEQVAGRLHDLL